MEIPCYNCVSLAICINEDLNLLKKKCPKMKSFICKRKGMTRIIRESDKYISTLKLREGKPILYIECINP